MSDVNLYLSWDGMLVTLFILAMLWWKHLYGWFGLGLESANINMLIVLQITHVRFLFT